MKALHGEGRLGHYRYRWIPKRKSRKRLLMEPKEPLHEAAHGFCEVRSVWTYEEPHYGKKVVVRMDLAGFFHFFQMLFIGKCLLSYNESPNSDLRASSQSSFVSFWGFGWK